jgi:UDP-2,4-diacetamido-2,4,6-trideoxy-beta-L-altropyranose hydrolase
MRPTVKIRTDASPQIGLGHLMRCIALANMLKEHFNITFFCREIPENLVNELAKSSFKLKNIANETIFFAHLKSRDIVVIDGYDFDTEYQKRIKKIGCKLVCIDDLHDKVFLADLIINHAPGVEPKEYQAQPYSQFALGLEYALLRPAFLKQAKNKKIIEKIETVLICFGGSDYKKLTESSISIVSTFSEFKKIIVITGPCYQYSDSLQELLSMDNRIIHYHSVGEEEMTCLMVEADLAIVPASSILYEAMATGLIVITGMSTNNQKIIYSKIISQKKVFDAKQFKPEHLKDALNKSLIRRNAKIAIDINYFKNSEIRILKIFQQLQISLFLELRKIESSDLDITYKWAIDPVIRSRSFTKHIISMQEHKIWFCKKLNEKTSLFLIAELFGKVIGSIRFDIEEGKAMISYLVDTVFHGKGLGTVLLHKGIEYLLTIEKEGKINEISGLVMKDNIPSIRAFERLGFVPVTQNNYINFRKACLMI